MWPPGGFGLCAEQQPVALCTLRAHPGVFMGVSHFLLLISLLILLFLVVQGPLVTYRHCLVTQ